MIKKTIASPIELYNSYDILVTPCGEVKTDILEKILEDANSAGIEKTGLILITKEKRVKGFNPDNPCWEEYQKAVSLNRLYQLYKENMGEPFKPKTYEEKQKKYRFR